MEFLKTKYVKTALVTSSTTRELENIEKHLRLLSLFDKVVSADSTQKHKPNPDPYLKALEI